MNSTAAPPHVENSAARGSEGRKSSCLFTLLLWIQGLYYLVTGVLPLVSIETFQMVTGRKTDHLVTGRESDHWLVMTVAVLIVAVAITLLVAAWRSPRGRQRGGADQDRRGLCPPAGDSADLSRGRNGGGGPHRHVDPGSDP